MKTNRAISLESSLWVKIDKLAKEKGRSISRLVEELLNQAIKDKKEN